MPYAHYLTIFLGFIALRECSLDIQGSKSFYLFIIFPQYFAVKHCILREVEETDVSISLRLLCVKKKPIKKKN